MLLESEATRLLSQVLGGGGGGGGELLSVLVGWSVLCF